jgi:transcriptional regulator with XRE-family HTH domain
MNESPPPLPVQRAIRKLGSDLSLARRRRHISQASPAERMGASMSTVRRMEKGDLRVPIHFIARALHVFGEIQALEGLLDTSRDDIGLTLMDEQLPKRVRRQIQLASAGPAYRSARSCMSDRGVARTARSSMTPPG